MDLRPSVICFGHGPPLYELAPLEEYLVKIEARNGSNGEVNNEPDAK